MPELKVTGKPGRRTVRCGVCGFRTAPGKSAIGAADGARKDGWKVVAGRNVCPRCQAATEERRGRTEAVI